MCKVENCNNKKVFRRGYCCKHYHRFLKYGDPLKGRTFNGEPLRWLEEHLTFEGDECLIWPFCCMPDGRAQIRFNGTKYTCRVICEKVYGPPEGDKTQAAHSCGNAYSGCVNPKHLRWASYKENEQDKKLHGTYHRRWKIGKRLKNLEESTGA